MGLVFLYLFLILCFGLLLQVVGKPALILEYPYFIAAIFFIFLVPQAIIIGNNPEIVPADAFTPLFASCFLCLAMAFAGYYFAPAIKIGKVLNVPLNYKKLQTIAVVYMLFGYLFSILIRGMYSSMEASGEDIPTQATGIVTIYFQFAQLLNIAFPILLFIALIKPDFRNIFLAVVSGFPTLYTIITAGRREPTAFFFLTIAFAFYYIYNVRPPRAAIIGVILLATLIIPATADYRSVAKKEGAWAALQSLDLGKSFKDYFNNPDGTYLELKVAAHVIDAYSYTGEFQYGAGYWDQMVFRYVPAQLVGSDVKTGMMLTKNIPFRNGYTMPIGLTLTGIGDSFSQFGYLGCIFFFLLGGFFRNLWRFSLSTTNILVLILYIICVVQSLLSVTHATVNFIPGVFFNFIFLWLAAVYAKEKPI